jgi:ATP-dependent RNA helicase DDX10/DBP4
MEHVRE